jgi:hypothetical protein
MDCLAPTLKSDVRAGNDGQAGLFEQSVVKLAITTIAPLLALGILRLAKHYLKTAA